jgi:2-succinyl-6-hydroxy-2,4-cyclohexadiene-1-carboxylate synthase
MKLTSRTWGRGPISAVFLHGFTGNADAFSHLEPALGDLFTATAFNLPGHADSECPTVTGIKGWQEIVESLSSLVPRNAVLVGYSQGARLALAVALKLQTHLARLVLESVSPGIRQRQKRNQRRKSDEVLASLIQSQGVERFVDSWEQLPIFGGIRKLDSESQASLRQRRVAHASQGLRSALESMGQGVQPNMWPHLFSLRVPTLLVTGSLDQKYNRYARQMGHEIPSSWHAPVPDCGHAPHLEAPAAYANELKNFASPLLAPLMAECVP